MRELYEEIDGTVRPDAWKADTSQARAFHGGIDPSTIPGVTLAVGDTWRKTVTNPLPTRFTVGVEATGQTLTPSSGNTTLGTNGQTIQNLDISGRVNVSANVSNGTVRKCRIRGTQIASGVSAGETTVGLVTCTPGGITNLLVEDCTLIPDYPSWDWAGILGHDFTLRRCLIAHTVDGIGIYNTSSPGNPVNVLVDSCYVNWLAFFSPTQSSNSDNATHNDATQIQGGSNIRFVNCVLKGFRSMPDGLGVEDDPYGYVGQGGLTVAPSGYDSVASGPYNPNYPAPTTTSGAMLNSNVGALSNVTFDSCYFDGGSVSINAVATLAAGSLTVTNCTFGHDQRLAGPNSGFPSSSNLSNYPRPTSDPYYNTTGTILNTAGKGYTITGNVYADNNVAILAR